MNNIELTISEDRMLATLFFTQPEGDNSITYEQIVDTIVESGIIFGVNQKILESLKENLEFGKAYEIARGESPKEGKNGSLEYYFSTGIQAKPAENEDGSVDFHNLGLINSVEVDDLLVTAIPEVEGEPGIDVYENEAPPPPVKKAQLPKFGKGVIKEGMTLKAKVEGHVDAKGDKIYVNEVLTISGDVGPSTGDIVYNGSVHVTGNILSGFSIKAKKNIEVMGLVEGATLLSTGNIIIRGGVQGMDKARLICNGRLVAKYIFNAFVKCHGIINTETILHSDVSCNDSIVVSGKGLISGGKVRANKVIDSKVIGTSMGTKTYVEVGTDPDIKEKFHEFKNKGKAIVEEQKKLKQIIRLLEDRKRKGVIKAEHVKTLEKSYATQEKLEADHAACLKVTETLLPMIENVKDGKVKVESVVYPGVIVSIGSTSKVINTKIDRCTLVMESGEVRVISY